MEQHGAEAGETEDIDPVLEKADDHDGDALEAAPQHLGPGPDDDDGGVLTAEGHLPGPPRMPGGIPRGAVRGSRVHHHEGLDPRRGWKAPGAGEVPE